MFLEELCRLYPEAPIYTLIYEPEVFVDSIISKHEVKASFINRLPFAHGHHRIYIPAMPLAIESLDLRKYDVVLSSSAAFAHGVRTHSKQLHISYIHSPMRYAWHQYEQHTGQLGYGAYPIRVLLSGLRSWDRKAAQRSDWLVANSNWTAKCVQEAFERDAVVIYPPVHVENFSSKTPRKSYYLTVSRLVPYKRVDLIVEAFNNLGLPLVIAGDGQEHEKLRRMAGPNIRFLNNQNDAQIAKLMGEAKAFVYAAEEDFGIAPVEAQAAGCRVVAFASGGLLETVQADTGLFFYQQSAEAIMKAIQAFESENAHFSRARIRKNAERFSAEIFRSRFTEFVDTKWSEFQAKA